MTQQFLCTVIFLGGARAVAPQAPADHLASETGSQISGTVTQESEHFRRIMTASADESCVGASYWLITRCVPIDVRLLRADDPKVPTSECSIRLQAAIVVAADDVPSTV